MAILIKRYANRKLYNTETSRYITLKGISELLDAGKEVRVVDNETGEDITSVALSQILVDSKRSNTSPPHTLLSQIFGRSGDALYGALRQRVDEATDDLGKIQERVRRIVQTGERGDEPEDSPAGREEIHPGRERPQGLGSWIHLNAPDLERLVQNSVERVFHLLDLPRRSDIAALNENLERVASAIETLEKVSARAERPPASRPEAHPEPDSTGAPQ